MKTKEIIRKKISIIKVKGSTSSTKITRPCRQIRSTMAIKDTQDLTMMKNGSTISFKTRGTGTTAIPTIKVTRAGINNNNTHTSSRPIRSAKIDTMSRTTDKATTRSTNAATNTSTTFLPHHSCSRPRLAIWMRCTLAKTLAAAISRSIYNR